MEERRWRVCQSHQRLIELSLFVPSSVAKMMDTGRAAQADLSLSLRNSDFSKLQPV